MTKTTPWIPVGHPDFKWSSGADVQALWRKYGWTPPSEKMIYSSEELLNSPPEERKQ